ncbi:MAG TPA: type IX secretion system protein PorQ [Chitinophagaceae bacterium]|nr:type IX secretion system protein PorQ [Chitinophagaceae bacterium]
MRIRIVIFFLLISVYTNSQTLGGNTVFNFLNFSNTPQLTALGGINISQTSNDVGLVFNNPALLRPAMHTQLNAVFNSFYAGINIYHLSLGYRNEKLNTNFSWGLNYFNYGIIQQTDASGNVLGTLKPADWVMQLSASHSYMDKWNYGATFKFINSNYGQYRANGVAMDAGILYVDSARLFSASVVAKNMGFQLRKYAGTNAQDIPFDLEIGITKRLQNAPLGFSITAHHIHQFDIRYNDTAFNNDNGFLNSSSKKISFDKIFRHLIFAAMGYVGDKIELTVGYNYLRRQELGFGNSGNGVNGFSLGVGVILHKMQIRYGRAYYQNNTAYNQLGLNLKLNEYFGLGKFGKNIGW